MYEEVKQQFKELAYVLLFFAVIIEGEFVLLVSGILAHLGALSFPILYIAGYLGAFGKTYVGYGLGVFLKRRYPRSRFFRFVMRRVNDLLPSFKKRSILVYIYVEVYCWDQSFCTHLQWVCKSAKENILQS
jgi:membrane protein DedA with SNARE-associated domain